VVRISPPLVGTFSDFEFSHYAYMNYFQIYHISRAEVLKYTNIFRPITAASSVSYSNRIIGEYVLFCLQYFEKSVTNETNLS